MARHGKWAALARLAALAAALALSAGQAHAVEVGLDTAAARAVLTALADPKLTEAQALSVAQLIPNQMMIRKVKDGHPNVSTQNFTDELLAAAHGSPSAKATMFHFAELAQKRLGVLAALDVVDAQQAELADWIAKRIDRFSPPGRWPPLKGYLIAGGSATGFTFGTTDFYLNIGDFSGDPSAVKFVAAHELYHALQGAVIEAHHQPWPGFDEDVFAKLTTPEAREAYVVNGYLGDLMVEGTATYVGDPSMMTGDGQETTAERERFQREMLRPNGLTNLLDVALTALTSPTPTPYNEAYSIAFNAPDQPLYYLGYRMSQALTAKYGDQRLGQAISQSGCDFAAAYLALTESDPSLPKFKPTTARLIRSHCPSSSRADPSPSA